MARSKKKFPEDDFEPSHEPPPLYWGLTANQVVAYNLAAARRWRQWTQDQAAEALEPYLGTRWSKANYSAAERSIAGNRIRQFSADEIMAFAQAFEVPVSWFFLPPPPFAAASGAAVPVAMERPGAKLPPTPLATMIDLVFGDAHGDGMMEIRLNSFFDQLGTGALTHAQRRVTAQVELRIQALVRHAFRDIDQWQRQLRGIANCLETLEVRSKPEKAADVWREMDEDLYGKDADLLVDHEQIEPADEEEGSSDEP